MAGSVVRQSYFDVRCSNMRKFTCQSQLDVGFIKIRKFNLCVFSKALAFPYQMVRSTGLGAKVAGAAIRGWVEMVEEGR